LLHAAGLDGDETRGAGGEPGVALVIAGAAEQLVALHAHAGEVDGKTLGGLHPVGLPERAVDRGLDEIHRNDGQLRRLPAPADADDRSRNAPCARCERLPAGKRHAAGIDRHRAHAVGRLRVPNAEEPSMRNVVLRAQPLTLGAETCDELQRVDVPFVEPSPSKITGSGNAELIVFVRSADERHAAGIGEAGAQRVIDDECFGGSPANVHA